jgi:hypothetical protein
MIKICFLYAKQTEEPPISGHIKHRTVASILEENRYRICIDFIDIVYIGSVVNVF